MYDSENFFLFSEVYFFQINELIIVKITLLLHKKSGSFFFFLITPVWVFLN